MTRFGPLLVAALALTVLPAAAAKGTAELSVRPAGARGPLVQYDLARGAKRFSLPAGMLSADGTRFVYVRGDKLIFYSVLGRRSYLEVRALHGSSVEAVAPQARYVVLRSGAELQVVGGVRGRTLRTLTLPRGFTVDAISHNGQSLYVIEHKSGHDYAVRRFNVTTGRLLAKELVQKGEQEEMAGVSTSAIQSRDGRWQLTLYVNTEHKEAFVHALSLDQAYTVCIDLPGTGSLTQLRTYSIALAPDGKRFYAANPALGVAATVSLKSFRLVPKRFPASTAARTARAAVSPDGKTLAFSAGSRIWFHGAAGATVRGPYPAGGEVVGLGFADARRLFAARAGGTLAAFDAAKR